MATDSNVNELDVTHTTAGNGRRWSHRIALSPLHTHTRTHMQPAGARARPHTARSSPHAANTQTLRRLCTSLHNRLRMRQPPRAYAHRKGDSRAVEQSSYAGPHARTQAHSPHAPARAPPGVQCAPASPPPRLRARPSLLPQSTVMHAGAT